MTTQLHEIKSLAHQHNIRVSVEQRPEEGQVIILFGFLADITLILRQIVGYHSRLRAAGVELVRW